MDSGTLTARLADVFACPSCGTQESREDEGVLVCGRGHRFPVVDGIPRFVATLPEDVRQVQRVFDFEHRRYQDSSYTRFGPDLVEQFLDDCRLPRDAFEGKRTLDAGCGSGRWTYALAELGAEVTGVDLTSGGIETAVAELGERPNVTFAQADLFGLPLRRDAFDFVLSWGVLHHTPDTRAAFDRLIPLVKPGGTLYVMVYEREGRLMHLGTEVVRRLLRRLPDDRRYRACRLLVLRRRALYRALIPLVMVSYAGPGSDVDVKTAQFGLFDAYSPRYNHLHTHEEVTGWFWEHGFEDVVVVPAAGRAVKVRGIRAG